MSNKILVNVRVDESVKAQAERVTEELGITLSSAINLFLTQMVREQALPFTPRLVSSFSEPKGELTAEKVKQKVSEFYSVPLKDLEGKKRSKEIVWARKVAMYLIKELLDLSLVEIGKRFNGKDHTVVIKAIQEINETMTEDIIVRNQIQKLRLILSKL